MPHTRLFNRPKPGFNGKDSSRAVRIETSHSNAITYHIQQIRDFRQVIKMGDVCNSICILHGLCKMQIEKFIQRITVLHQLFQFDTVFHFASNFQCPANYHQILLTCLKGSPKGRTKALDKGVHVFGDN